MMEALGRMLDKAVNEGHMSRFSVGNLEGRSLAVSHLPFADDTLIFCEADLDQILILHMILIWFKVVSHLLFVDDTLIFCEADLDQILILRMILIWFEAVSGLKIGRAHV